MSLIVIVSIFDKTRLYVCGLMGGWEFWINSALLVLSVYAFTTVERARNRLVRSQNRLIGDLCSALREGGGK